MQQNLHEYQMSILRELLFKPKSKFSEIKKVDVENYHFNFHLKKLVEEDLVIKENGLYSLSVKGKEFANKMDTDSLEIEKQAKVAVSIHCIRFIKGKREFLMQQRLKEPFFGWYGAVTGKISWGETPLTTARRELKEETGLTGKFELKSIVHYHHLDANHKLLEDKYFFCFVVTDTKGKLKKKIEEGKNIWVRESDYYDLQNTFATYDQWVEAIDCKSLKYIEREEVVNDY